MQRAAQFSDKFSSKLVTVLLRQIGLHQRLRRTAQHLRAQQQHNSMSGTTRSRHGSTDALASASARPCSGSLATQRLDANRQSNLTAAMERVDTPMESPPVTDDLDDTTTCSSVGCTSAGLSRRSRWRDLSALLRAVNSARDRRGLNYRAELSHEAKSGILVVITLSSIVNALSK